MTTTELEKMRKAAAESVRRGVSFDDWMDEVVPRLMNGSNDHLDRIVATNICSNMWRTAIEDQKS